MSENPLFDVQKVVRVLGDTSEWDTPQGYRSSLALCVMDSIWSLGIRYRTVEKVLDRYLKARGFAGLEDAQSCLDGPRALLDWSLGSKSPEGHSEAFAVAVQNWNRTSSSNGVLKADAVLQACRLLDSMGIDSTQDLLAQSDVVEPRWRSEVKGQASGISWKYLLMLAGQSGVKPDRMVLRFMQRMGAGVDTSPDEFVLAIVKHIDREGIDATAVDYRIWSIERDMTADDFSDLRAEVSHFAYEREWDQFHSVKNLFLALVGEMGEVAELIQWKSDVEIEDYLKTSDGNARMSEELADVFIYLMRLAEKAGVDLTQVTYKKLSINEEKYSIDSSRGNATKYNERS
jgi:NTP pyrophosphatase (non-canonical NTP hydrolase)